MLLFIFGGCSEKSVLFLADFHHEDPVIVVAPSAQAEADLDVASTAYVDVVESAADNELSALPLQSCLVLAVRHNRSLRRRTYATQRFGLERKVQQSELDQATFVGSYSIDEGADGADARAGVVSRVAGFEIEPFVDFLYDEFEDDPTSTSYGVAISRNVFRIDHEHLHQYLPLTRATKDFHVAINNRILELRDLHLSVVRRFYDIQRFKMRVRVRNNRVEDAKDFLDKVSQRLEQGMAAPNERTNAQISLNQAKADLVRERTNLENARDALLDLLGIDLDRAFTIAADEWEDDPRLGTSLDEHLALVNRAHERVLNQLLQIEVQRQAYRVSQDKLIPDLVATLSAAKDVDRDGDEDRVNLDLKLEVPLDGHRVEKAQLTQDRLFLMELTVELAEVRSDLKRQLRASHRNITQLNTAVRLAKERLEHEHGKLKAQLDRYQRVGGPDLSLEVSRAKDAVDRAEVELLTLRVGRITEEARYQSLLPAPRALRDECDGSTTEEGLPVGAPDEKQTDQIPDGGKHGQDSSTE